MHPSPLASTHHVLTTRWAGAAVTIFVMGFCLGGLTEFGGERAVRRFAHGGGWCTGFAGGRVGWKFSAAGQYSLHYKGLITIY